eukprot:CAMPEP_0194318332 /NCGR_PEP_ID=MMETSP0171-20130528/14960_1 /TAXON_ID=218684 /ORGANISM="Corethron pennatum, Strain L29A3" /LENGTH=425 /DNA_ID=CAMNT_0039075209 /DNA_START=151 /DNA_END=1428 /DNA_ORIENTATION=-
MGRVMSAENAAFQRTYPKFDFSRSHQWQVAFEHNMMQNKGGAKLAFCWIQKVGCTTIKRVFKNLLKTNNEIIWRRNQIIPNNRHLITYPDVHRAVFYREPLERFLSGYLDKCRYEAPSFSYCQIVFGGKDVSFPDAVMLLPSKYPDPKKLDWHFMPQHLHCGGLSRALLNDTFTTVKMLQSPPSDHNVSDSTTREVIRTMIRQSGFNLTNADMEHIVPPPRPGGHAQYAHDKLFEYYGGGKGHNADKDALVAVIVKYFLEDYLVFDMEVPAFAAEALGRLRRSNDPRLTLTDDEWKALKMPTVILPEKEQLAVETVMMISDVGKDQRSTVHPRGQRESDFILPTGLSWAYVVVGCLCLVTWHARGYLTVSSRLQQRRSRHLIDGSVSNRKGRINEEKVEKSSRKMRFVVQRGHGKKKEEMSNIEI